MLLIVRAEIQARRFDVLLGGAHEHPQARRSANAARAAGRVERTPARPCTGGPWGSAGHPCMRDPRRNARRSRGLHDLWCWHRARRSEPCGRATRRLGAVRPSRVLRHLDAGGSRAGSRVEGGLDRAVRDDRPPRAFFGVLGSHPEPPASTPALQRTPSGREGATGLGTGFGTT